MSPRIPGVWRASDLAELVDGRLEGRDRIIEGVAPLETAGAGELAWSEGKRGAESQAEVLLCQEAIEGRSCVLVVDPKAAFIAVLNAFFPTEFEAGVHPSAVIHPSAEVSAEAQIGPFVVVGARCRVGARSVLHPHVVLYAGTRLGEGVVVHAGTVLGADGFSYHPGASGLIKVPQLGGVMIEDEVEIGANSCVDRAFLKSTRIGPGAKIDNLVQVGHNSQIGAHVVIAAQTGLSGSVEVGTGAMLGGQVGVGDHVSIGAGARVGGKSGVTRNLKGGETYLGKLPAQPAAAFRRIVGAMKKLPELWTRLRRLEDRVGDLEEK